MSGTSFNTASGMDCMQLSSILPFQNEDAGTVSIPQAVWIACNAGHDCESACKQPLFQYRKRYGLHAISVQGEQRRDHWKFQYRKRYGLHAIRRRCSFQPCGISFQYRKRYGLHAIPSLTALGTAKPRSGFSKRNALLGKSPQTRGIFLSPKTAENVRKPCNIKETFVHGKSMKLMAFSPKSLPSL